MDGGNEQKVATKFCFKAQVSVTETLVMTQKAYGNETLNRSYFLGGILDFETEGELVEDDERGGCPQSTRTEVNVAAVAHVHKMTVELHQE